MNKGEYGKLKWKVELGARPKKEIPKTFYSYDDHGNVTKIVQVHYKLQAQFGTTGIGLQITEYEYDLISGNMNKAIFQRNKAGEQFMHRYYYDDDNRLKEVFTSKDDLNWDRDAKYIYYEHGSLARIERADKQVQGSDYFYTMQGWIKGVNSDALTVSADVGKDGASGNAFHSSYSDVHLHFARDAAAFSLNYYTTSTLTDYKGINESSYNNVNFENPIASTAALTVNPFNLSTEGANLYNGNISSMVTTFIDKDPLNVSPTNAPNPQLTAYQYDQLHRLVKMKAYRNLVNNTWQTPTVSNTDDSYKMTLSYDMNGNIKTLTRNGASGNVVAGSNLGMDNLTYTYFESANAGGVVSSNSYNSNKLACVQDGVASSNYGDDIDNYASCTETSPRYGYDVIGNLIQDKGEYISTIEWTVDRKVKRVIRDAAAMLATGTGPGSVTKPDIEYEYNALRQRIVKIVKPRDVVTKQVKSFLFWTYTYYTHDASGNVMAIYTRSISPIGTGGSQYRDALTLSEQTIYGSSRLAVSRPSNSLATWSYSFTVCGGDPSSCRTAGGGVNLPPGLQVSGSLSSRVLGFKEFELTNHLGNVIATVSDRKLQLKVCSNMEDGVPELSPFCGLTPVPLNFAGYFPDLLMHTDYYAFGQSMPGRTWISSVGGYRYGMNGQEKDNEIFEGAQSAEFWMYDSRLGRRWERDPITYPWQSPYACFNNNPIRYADPKGLKGKDNGKKDAGSKGGGELSNETKITGNNTDGYNLPEVEILTTKPSPRDIKTAHVGVKEAIFKVSMSGVKEGKFYDPSYDITNVDGITRVEGTNQKSIWRNIISYGCTKNSTGGGNYYDLKMEQELIGEVIKKENTETSYFGGSDLKKEDVNKNIDEIKDFTNIVQNRCVTNQGITAVYIDISVAKNAGSHLGLSRFRNSLEKAMREQLGSGIPIIWGQNGNGTLSGNGEGSLDPTNSTNSSTFQIFFELSTVKPQ